MDIKEYNGTSLAYMGDAVLGECEGTGVFSDSAERACIFQ